MCINYKQAILAGVINYAVLFLAISAMMFTPLWGTPAQTYLNMVVGLVVTYFVASYLYFKKKPKEPLKEGICLGIVFAVISFLIEIPVMAYGFAAAQGWAWFTQWNMIVSYVLCVVAVVAAAMMKK